MEKTFINMREVGSISPIPARAEQLCKSEPRSFRPSASKGASMLIGDSPGESTLSPGTTESGGSEARAQAGHAVLSPIHEAQAAGPATPRQLRFSTVSPPVTPESQVRRAPAAAGGPALLGSPQVMKTPSTAGVDFLRLPSPQVERMPPTPSTVGSVRLPLSLELNVPTDTTGRVKLSLEEELQDVLPPPLPAAAKTTLRLTDLVVDATAVHETAAHELAAHEPVGGSDLLCANAKRLLSLDALVAEPERESLCRRLF